MTTATQTRRRRTAKGGGGQAGTLTSPQFGRRLFVVMAVVGALYAGIVLYGAVHGARTFGMAFMGMTRAEVRYFYGVPTAQQAGDMLWRVRDGDAETSLLFDPADRLAVVGCRGIAGSVGADCPATFGLHLGDGEEAVWTRLGAPTDESFAGDSKVMTYPALGIRLKLRRATIVAIEHRHISGTVAFALRAATLLGP